VTPHRVQALLLVEELGDVLGSSSQHALVLQVLDTSLRLLVEPGGGERGRETERDREGERERERERQRERGRERQRGRERDREGEGGRETERETESSNQCSSSGSRNQKVNIFSIHGV